MKKELYAIFEQKQVEQYYTQKPARDKSLKPLFDIKN